MPGSALGGPRLAEAAERGVVESGPVRPPPTPVASIPLAGPAGALPQGFSPGGPVQLGYAMPMGTTLLPLSPDHFTPQPDAGPFRALGSRLTVGGNEFLSSGSRWVGRAVASPYAIYLFKRRRLFSGYGVGGVLGAGIGRDHVGRGRADL